VQNAGISQKLRTDVLQLHGGDTTCSPSHNLTLLRFSAGLDVLGPAHAL
jgi:hypothetical protein